MNKQEKKEQTSLPPRSNEFAAARSRPPQSPRSRNPGSTSTPTKSRNLTTRVLASKRLTTSLLIHCANYLGDHKKKLFSHCYRGSQLAASYEAWESLPTTPPPEHPFRRKSGQLTASPQDLTQGTH